MAQRSWPIHHDAQGAIEIAGSRHGTIEVRHVRQIYTRSLLELGRNRIDGLKVDIGIDAGRSNNGSWYEAISTLLRHRVHDAIQHRRSLAHRGVHLELDMTGQGVEPVEEGALKPGFAIAIDGEAHQAVRFECPFGLRRNKLKHVQSTLFQEIGELARACGSVEIDAAFSIQQGHLPVDSEGGITKCLDGSQRLRTEDFRNLFDPDILGLPRLPLLPFDVVGGPVGFRYTPLTSASPYDESRLEPKLGVGLAVHTDRVHENHHIGVAHAHGIVRKHVGNSDGESRYVRAAHRVVHVVRMLEQVRGCSADPDVADFVGSHGAKQSPVLLVVLYAVDQRNRLVGEVLVLELGPRSTRYGINDAILFGKGLRHKLRGARCILPVSSGNEVAGAPSELNADGSEQQPASESREHESCHFRPRWPSGLSSFDMMDCSEEDARNVSPLCYDWTHANRHKAEHGELSGSGSCNES